MPYSRAMIAACESAPPVSVTTPAATVNSGVQAGSVYRPHDVAGQDGRESDGPSTRPSRRGDDRENPGVPLSARLIGQITTLQAGSAAVMDVLEESRQCRQRPPFDVLWPAKRSRDPTYEFKRLAVGAVASVRAVACPE